MPINILSQNGQMVRKPTLTAAFTDADTAGKTVVITGPVTAGTLDTDGRSLEIKQGGVITIPTGATLTINGPFQAGLFQCFDGDGSVVFGSGSVTEVYPEWWGASGQYDTDDQPYIQKAINAHNKVVLNGNYKIKRGLVIQRSNVELTSNNHAELCAMPGFESTTLFGTTASSMVWYCSNVDPTADDISTTSMIGGSISNIKINGNNPYSATASSALVGIRLDRISQRMVLRDLHIRHCGVGVHNAGFGWSHLYENLHIEGSEIHAILLGQGVNGTSINKCYLIGNLPVGGTPGVDGYRTQIQLKTVDNASSYGNSYTGGAIELCEAGVSIVDAQFAFSGVDFEDCSYRFAQIVTKTTSPSRQAPSTFTGCAFVGVPSDTGIYTENTPACVTGCTFLTFANTGAVYAMTGANSPSLSYFMEAYNNTFSGDVPWTNRHVGFVRYTNWESIYEVGVLTPTSTGVTATNPIYNGSVYRKFGGVITFQLVLQADAGTISCGSGSGTYFEGFPYAGNIVGPASCSTSSGDFGVLDSSLLVTNGRLYPPAMIGKTQIVISGSYFVTV